MKHDQSKSIAVDELRVGMFVELDVGWMSHPFPTGSFRISSEKQIEAIRALGLSQVRYFPEKSDTPATDPAEASAGGSGAPAVGQAHVATVKTGRRERFAMLSAADEQRRRQLRCEQGFQDAVALYRLVQEQAQAQPRLIKERCDSMIGGLLDELLQPGDSSIRLLSASGAERSCMHAVNVSVLSLLLGNAMGLPRDQLAQLGSAAFLHDIGKILLPERVRALEESFSLAETRLYQDHVSRSVELAQSLHLSNEAITAIAQHHEHPDGTGFPQRSRGSELSLPGRILALVNRFDSLCNPTHPVAAMTPHEALSNIFTQMKGRFDAAVVSAFIRMMGVHPPGSVVELTNDRYALVVMANTSRPLKPQVLMHDPAIPRHGAPIIDLEKMPAIGIRRGIRPGSLPADISDYLALRQRVCYFFDRAEPELQAA